VQLETPRPGKSGSRRHVSERAIQAARGRVLYTLNVPPMVWVTFFLSQVAAIHAGRMHVVPCSASVGLARVSQSRPCSQQHEVHVIQFCILSWCTPSVVLALLYTRSKTYARKNWPHVASFFVRVVNDYFASAVFASLKDNVIRCSFGSKSEILNL